jgi:hypothetical protein
MRATLSLPANVHLYTLLERVKEVFYPSALSHISFSADWDENGDIRLFVEWEGIASVNRNVEFAVQLVKASAIDAGTLSLYEQTSSGEWQLYRHYVVVVGTAETAEVR